MDYESTVNAEPEVNVEPQETEEFELTADVDSEIKTEVVEDAESVEGEVATPKQSKETNSEFAKVRKEAESRAKEMAIQEANNRIAMLYSEYGINNIDELEQAITRQKRESEEATLIERGYSQEDIDEILEAREIKRIDNERKQQEAKTQNLDRMIAEFSSTFPDVKIESLPAEVVSQVNSGVDLTKAYALYQINNIGTIKAQAQQDAIKALKENADSSTGPLSAPSQEQPSMTTDQVNRLLETMSAQQRNKWIDSNYSNLEKWGYFKNF